MSGETRVLSRQDLELAYLLLRESSIRKARKNFYLFCRLLHSDFYTDDKIHLQIFCDLLQDLYEKKLFDDKGELFTRLCNSIPPRHGKSRTLFLFCCWCFGQNINEMVLYLSYSDASAIDFSRFTRDEIQRVKYNPADIVFSDIFPSVKLKDGDASVQKWSLEGRHFSYAAAGLGGAVTGKGATIIIIDDPIKGSYEAFNKNHKQYVINWLIGTVFSRAEAGCIEIINMTRWASDDPIGYIRSSPDASKWFINEMPALNPDGSMLCPSILNKERFEYLERNADPVIFAANYLNKLIDEDFLMYPSLKRYNKAEFDRKMFYSRVKPVIRSMCDPADGGNDFFSAPIGDIFEAQIYIKDWLHTREDTSQTPRQYAEMLVKNNVSDVSIESNAGGGILANYLKDILYLEYKTRNITINTFPQLKNKEARIRDAAQWIINNVFFPDDFHITHPIVWRHFTTFLRVGKNENDDCEDALTRFAEEVMTNSLDVLKGWID